CGYSIRLNGDADRIADEVVASDVARNAKRDGTDITRPVCDCDARTLSGRVDRVETNVCVRGTLCRVEENSRGIGPGQGYFVENEGPAAPKFDNDGRCFWRSRHKAVALRMCAGKTSNVEGD